MDLSSLNPAQHEMAKAVIKQCAQSRVWYVRNVLKVKKIEAWQLKVLEELDAGITKKSVRSGHGVGKTTLIAWCATHYLLFRDDVKIVVTSPSFAQLTDGLIPEIRKWISKLPEWMASQLDVTSERVVRLPNGANNFISFRTARAENPEALAGIHATHVMILVDEASGVAEVIFETGQGSLSTPGAIILLIGNPTRPTGFFHKTQTILSDMWNSIKVSCYDSTQVAATYIDDIIRTYGADSREFRVRVLGEFPESGADAVIPRNLVDAAMKRDVDPIDRVRYWGVDPGRGGDPSGFVDRSPNCIFDVQELRYDNIMMLVGWVKKRWDATPTSLRPENIYVDSIGLGAGVVDRLAELGLPVVGVNVSESASMSARFVRLRPELWYTARDWFESMAVGCMSNVPDSVKTRLTEELCCVTEKISESSGKIDIISKAEIKKLIQRSTNLADAFVLTMAGDGSVMNGVSRGSWAKIDTSKYRAPGLV